MNKYFEHLIDRQKQFEHAGNKLAVQVIDDIFKRINLGNDYEYISKQIAAVVNENAYCAASEDKSFGRKADISASLWDDLYYLNNDELWKPINPNAITIKLDDYTSLGPMTLDELIQRIEDSK